MFKFQSLKHIFLLAIVAVWPIGIQAQTVVDEVVAVVGASVVLQSDIEIRAFQMEADERGNRVRSVSRCEVLEDVLIQKVLVAQAVLDSVIIEDDEVDAEIDRRINMQVSQAGGRERLEKLMGRTLDDLRLDIRDNVYEDLVIQRMQFKITGEVQVTPSEVRRYFDRIPKDSLPLIPGEVELAHIAMIPQVREEENQRVLQALEKMKAELEKGSSFCIKSKFYSEDPGSAENCGELGFMKREDLVPEFSAVAFGLEPGQISAPVKTQFGYHIIELLDKRGQYANFRHVLMRPKVALSDLVSAEEKLTALIQQLDSIDFATLAIRYSEDKETANNGGRLMNPSTGSGRFMLEELDPATYQLLSTLKEGQHSKPQVSVSSDGQKMVRVLYVNKRIDAHTASLEQDYARIQQAALNEKKMNVLKSWIDKRKKNLHIQVQGYKESCPELNQWNP
ncbi:MAG: foldase protein PrsA [Flavobacteriales bacterium]|jgi:peptidyl-prolyl cis-trans isomerase SurA